MVFNGFNGFLLLSKSLHCGLLVAFGWCLSAINARTGQSCLKSVFLRTTRTFVMRLSQRNPLGATIESCKSPWFMSIKSGREVLSRSGGLKNCAHR